MKGARSKKACLFQAREGPLHWVTFSTLLAFRQRFESHPFLSATDIIRKGGGSQRVSTLTPILFPSSHSLNSLLVPVHDGCQSGRKRGRSMYPARSRASCRSTHHFSFLPIPPGCLPGIGSSKKGMYWDMGRVGYGRLARMSYSAPLPHYIIWVPTRPNRL